MTINVVVGQTDPDPEDGHVHQYSLRLTTTGRLIGGLTSTVNKHYHTITNVWTTDSAIGYNNTEEIPEHTHLFDFIKSEFISGLLDEREKGKDTLPKKV